MLSKPDIAWVQVEEEDFRLEEIFKSYLIPVTVVTSLFVFLLSLVHYTVWQASGLAVINLLSSNCGVWFSFLITKEYLCGKLNYRSNQALNLTVYSSAIYIIFHSLGAALGNVFLGQLFTLLSFIFIRTLYTGIRMLPEMTSGQKTNVLIITSLSIICIPIIITQILMIVFRISAFNV